MCKALPARALIEPLEPRRLLSAEPMTFDPLTLAGAYERPDGSIVVPNISLALSGVMAAPSAVPSGAADDTAGFFSTTAAPRAEAQPVAWDADAALARPASEDRPLPIAGVSGIVYGSSGGYSEGGAAEPNSNTAFSGPRLYGWLAFSLTSCNYGSNADTSPVTVSYQLGGSHVGSGIPAATPGKDYSGPLVENHSVQLADHSTVLVPFRATADNEVEGQEEVRATITGGAGTYRGAGNFGFVYIDDSPPVVKVEAKGQDGIAVEPPNPLPPDFPTDKGAYTFTRRGGDLGAELKVTYKMLSLEEGASATNGVDHDVLGGEITFAANETSKVVVLNPKQENDWGQGDETAIAKILPGSYTIEVETAGVTIHNIKPVILVPGFTPVKVGDIKTLTVKVVWDGTPYPAAAGDTLFIKDGSFNPDVIEPQQRSVVVKADGTVDIQVKGLRVGASGIIFGVKSSLHAGVGIEAPGRVDVVPHVQYREWPGGTLGPKDAVAEANKLHPVYDGKTDKDRADQKAKFEKDLATTQKELEVSGITFGDTTITSAVNEIVFQAPGEVPNVSLTIPKITLPGFKVEAEPIATLPAPVNGGREKAFQLNYKLTLTINLKAYGVQFDAAGILLNFDLGPKKIVASQGKIVKEF